jgi:hypothetical protein
MTWHAPSLAAEEVRLVIYIKDKSIAERELLIWTQQQTSIIIILLTFKYFLFYSYAVLLCFVTFCEVTRGPGWTFVTSVTRERWSSTPLRTLWSNAI